MPDQDTWWWGRQHSSQPFADKTRPAEEQNSSSVVIVARPLLVEDEDPPMVGPLPPGKAQQAAPLVEPPASSQSTRSIVRRKDIDWDGVLTEGDVIQAELEEVSSTRNENGTGQSLNIANVARATEDRAQSFVDEHDRVDPGSIEALHQIMANRGTFLEETRLIPYIKLDYNFSRDEVHDWLGESTWDQSKLFRLQYWLTSRRIPVDAAVLRLLQDVCYGRLQRG
ncbi:hypothetical protein CB0940_03636 [Cercospora beticola]|uniref:Uncharacterized protein n=1 Tax=Cercospora beticola TaxID=122368 RepID=A0A2G5I350_CERBT|nr:hypothetical protein CB0940_03636 [Cercospora beticola]PIA98923.1 hypothetical protein CB0940_03636 [Cercospora beticola]WPB00815.1 hypothetical protein RHO25_005435 [Cercospora beticola]